MVLVLDGLWYFIRMSQLVDISRFWLVQVCCRDGWSWFLTSPGRPNNHQPIKGLDLWPQWCHQVPHGELVEGILTGVKKFSQFHLQVFPAQLPVNLYILAALGTWSRYSKYCQGEGQLKELCNQKKKNWTCMNPDPVWTWLNMFHLEPQMDPFGA